jgi:hypothetical protein
MIQWYWKARDEGNEVFSACWWKDGHFHLSVAKKGKNIIRTYRPAWEPRLGVDFEDARVMNKMVDDMVKEIV